MLRPGLALLILLAACGDDDAPGADAAASSDASAPDAPAPDAEPPDAGPPDAQPSMGVGLACADDLSCGAMKICLDEEEGFPPGGYCTRLCTSDDDCGGDAFCSPPLDDQNNRACFLECTGAGGCDDADYICSDRLGGFLLLPQGACMYGDATAHDGDACGSMADCNVNSFCLSNPFSFPGGYCLTVGCTPGDDSTCAPGGDALCTPQDQICIDRCAGAGNCRTAEGYECVQVQVGTSVCFVPHAAGDPCGTAADCGGAPWECLTGGAFPDGYCTNVGCDAADENTCPLDTPCYDPNLLTPGDEFCAQPCTQPTDCRAGYTCTDVGLASMICL